MNNHDGTFTDRQPRRHWTRCQWLSRRGAAFGDVANDGNIDVLLLNVGEPPSCC